MTAHTDATVPSMSTRRPRKSTGHSPVRKRMDKENITVDVASSLAGNGARKKSRSKSMGPGGLDVLKSGSGNRRVSLAASARPPPRSILKPTIPLIPEIPPHKPKSRNGQQSSKIQGADNLPNPFQNDDSSSSGTKIALRTEEDQHAAAREREEKERAALEKEIKDRRDARRKSLANRRVSFAAEATLHTFHEIEYMQDSTTSTDSTRRSSSLTAQSPALTLATSQEPSDPPSTPPEQVEHLVPESPEPQRDLHQQKRRRSSGGASLNFTNHDDDTLASTFYSSDSEATDGVIETHEEISSDSGSDSDDDGTTMDLDVDEITGTSVASARTMMSDDSNDTLDGALRLAARQAQTQSVDEEEEIIPSFGWAKKPTSKQQSPGRSQQGQSNRSEDHSGDDIEQENDTGMDMDMEMEMTHAMGGIIKANGLEDDAEDEDMSMDVTKALGGILPQQSSRSHSKSVSPDKSSESSSLEDATMDLTMAIGAIRQAQQPPEDDLLELESNGDNEDMSMELTTVMGGVLAQKQAAASRRKSLPTRRRTLRAADDEATMDMTIGLGRIIPASEIEEAEDDGTMGMDMTMAMGGIIKGPSPVKDRSEAKQLMEQEVDKADSTPVMASSPSRRRLSALTVATSTTETGSPGLSAFHGTGLRRSTDRRASNITKPTSPVHNPTPSKSSSPFKAATPKAKAPSTPLRTPQSKRAPSRSASPQRSAANGSTNTPKPAQKSHQRSNIFQQDPSTGVSTPRVVLTPQKRRLSGVGADRSGLGSPKVAAIMDRRGSIGEAANDFVPGRVTRGVSFANPRIIEAEIDKDRQDEEDRESGRSILEREANGDDDNSTATLKDMIASMTPKKKGSSLLKGRKSLAVGSAKGLLGKRPAELDSDEEREERDGVKRLKGHQSSPVKNVRLHAPPSKAETTGRITRSTRRSLEETSGTTTTPTITLSPQKGSKGAPSPQGKGRFKDVENDQPTDTFSFEEPPRPVDPELYEDDQGERIHLQDFLNMTSIRFMELTTTKRRHTQAPAAMQDSTLHREEDISLERCVVAGACTVPMLELYQHSCRELKKYISEGRRIIREIETETLEENPPLFREYLSATPEFKNLMDNQFKNVKTNARLLSKAMWYEWRMKLQDGLKEGLVRIGEGMDVDDQLLKKEEELLQSVLPDLANLFEALQSEHEVLESAAQELADCDPDDLQAARDELVEVDSDVSARTRQIEELRQVLQDTESTIGDMTQRKQECATAVEEAEKVREECRGWTSNEINALKARVDEIEEQHGWNITGISETTVSMTYRREIEVVFDIASFQGSKPNSRIDLWYIACSREPNPQPSTPEKEFFIQCIRDYVRSLAQAQTKISTLLRVVSAAWQQAGSVSDDIHLLNCTFPTQVVKTGDSSIAVKIALLLAPLQTKVSIVLGLQGRNTPDGVEVAIVPCAEVVYGEHFKVDKVGEYLTTRIGDRVVAKEENETRESWGDVVVELHERLLARGR
ncbi:Spc7 kinetochore protein, partial [Xylariales sp. AK1849]